MAINLENISDKIFKIMKANGLVFYLFKEDGEATLDPKVARRFYSKNKNIMINLESTKEKTTMKVGVGKSVDIQDMRNFFDSLRTLASQNAISYVLRTFSKDISPKDFDFENLVNESFSTFYGTIKTSRQKFENATLYIRHKKSVNEEIRGARSRYIHSIFIENNNGERFKFPYRNLLPARAMTVHVSEGGTPYDTKGKFIISLAEEINELKKFKSCKKKDVSVNENISLFINEAHKRILEINKVLKRMNNKKGYGREINEITEQTYDNDLLEKYDIYLDETFEKAKPYLNKIAYRINENSKKENNLIDLVNKVISNNNLKIKSDVTQSTPDNLSFNDIKSQLSAWFGYFAEIIDDEGIVQQLRNLSDDIYVIDEKHIDLAKKLLTVLKKFVIVGEQYKPKIGMYENHIQKMENIFNNFLLEYK
jgi:hypothetical protein